MIALTALFLIGFWALISFGIAKLFVVGVKNRDTKFLANCLLAVLVALIPISPEIVGAFRFEYQCSSMKPAKFYIPASVKKDTLIDSKLNILWSGYSEWKIIEEKIFGNEDDFKKIEKETVISSFPFKVISTRFIYAKNGVRIKEFERYNSSGSWLGQFFSGMVQYQCMSPAWGSPKDYTQLYFENK